jgi:alpha-L-fucosidase
VSDDGSTWKLMSEGEFSNIKNNPTWQIKSFEQTKARFIKLKALKNIKENSNSGYAEIDILTK